MSANCNLIVQKANKVNSVVLAEKYMHFRYMEKVLDDATKFEKVKIKNGILNFLINHERSTNDYLKSLEKSCSSNTDQCKKIQAIVSRKNFIWTL